MKAPAKATIRTVSGIEFARRTEPLPEGAVDKRCPVCGRQGRKVTALTVTAHLRPEFWDCLADTFWFCWTSDCPILYYDNTRMVYASKDLQDVFTRFGLKEREFPRPICYCLGVSMERILDEVANKRCCDSLEDVERFTRAGTGKWCSSTNPSGVCCRSYLKDVVANALEAAHGDVRPAVEGVAGSLEEVGEETTVSETLKVGGMHCETCTLSVAAALEHAGARNVRVDFVEAKARFDRPRSRGLDTYEEALSDAGFTTTPRTEG